MIKEGLIRFWKSSASGSGSRKFLKDSSTLRDKEFSQFGSYLRKELSDFRENFTAGVSLDKEVPLNFGGNPGGESGSGYGLRIRRFSLTEVCGLCLVLLS